MREKKNYYIFVINYVFNSQLSIYEEAKYERC